MVPFHILGTQIFCSKLMPNNNSSSHGYSTRKQKTKKIKQRFLIVCEGKETEPNYFKDFRVKTAKIYIKGFGKDPNQLLKEANKLLKKEKQAKRWEKGDQVWCVFDRDSWKEEDFNKAITDAKKEGFRIAYSNEAFELWYILHFEYLNTAIPRKEYCKKLTEHLNNLNKNNHQKKINNKYQKNDQEMYYKLLNKQKTAIENAKRLYDEYDHSNPAKENPSTTVHELVQELNKYL